MKIVDIDASTPAHALREIGEAALRADGAIVFRGSLGFDEYLDITNAFCTDFLPYLGGSNHGRELVDEDAQIMTAPGGANNHAIAMHGEMYYQQTRPDLLFFQCHTPARRDGETLLADGCRVFSEMGGALRDGLAERRVTYHRRRDERVWTRLYRTSDREVLRSYCAQMSVDARFDDDGCLWTRFTDAASHRSRGGAPAFINNVLTFGLQALRCEGQPFSWVTYDDGQPIPAEILLEAERLVAGLVQPIRWRRGDVLIVDNARMLHGRNAFDDPERRILLRMGMGHP